MEANAKSKARGGVLRGVLVLGAVATAIVANACSSDSEDKTDDPFAGGKPDINQAANDPSIEMPVDATPSPDGKDIYYVAHAKAPGEDGLGFERQAAVYKVSAQGGPSTKLHQGAPLVSPFGITISNDGQTLYIADSGADTSDDRADGKVFTLGVGGGTPAPLGGTDGLAPGGVEVAGDSLYITGKKDGKPGLYKTGLNGGQIAAVAAGAPFVDPSGVAVTKKGEAYVVDSGSAISGQALASVVKISAEGKTEILIDGLSVGHPAGIALTNDDNALLVSGFDAAKGTDVVFTVNLADKQVGEFTDKIADFTESAGLHRARNANVFAWADSHAQKTGTVYTVTLGGK
jgi:sugar lactone lactonase YvrE